MCGPSPRAWDVFLTFMKKIVYSFSYFLRCYRYMNNPWQQMQLEGDCKFLLGMCSLQTQRTPSLFLSQEVRGWGKSVLISSKEKCVILILIRLGAFSQGRFGICPLPDFLVTNVGG